MNHLGTNIAFPLHRLFYICLDPVFILVLSRVCLNSTNRGNSWLCPSKTAEMKEQPQTVTVFRGSQNTSRVRAWGAASAPATASLTDCKTQPSKN